MPLRIMWMGGLLCHLPFAIYHLPLACHRLPCPALQCLGIRVLLAAQCLALKSFCGHGATETPKTASHFRDPSSESS